MKSILAIPPTLFLTLAVAACGEARAPEATPAPAEVAAAPITAADAWCRPTPTGAPTGACYVTLTAAGDDRLTGVSTPAATLAQIHDMTTEGGMMKMSEMADGLPLPAGETVTLAPGGKHLMLMDLAAPLTAGQTMALTLDFETSPDLTVEAAVRQPPANAAH